MEECIFGNDSTMTVRDLVVDVRKAGEEENISTAGILLSVQVADVSS